MLDDLAMRIAKRLKDEWAIGSSSRFCDEPPDFDSASEEEIAEVIREVMSSG
jgi:hypothetical protein